MKKITLLLALTLTAFAGNGQNNSLNFDGTDDYVNLGDNYNFANSDEFSAEAWIKIDESSNQYSQVISKLDANFRGWGLQVTDLGTISGYLISSFLVNQRYVEGTADLADGIWHHVAMTYDGDEIILYVDGVLEPISISNNLGDLGPVVNAGNTHIGNYDAEGTPGEQMSGRIDELRIWNGVRTASEIADNYLTELNGTESNLLGYYKMDEDDSQCDVVDCSPSVNHGERAGSAGTNPLPQFSTETPNITDVECDENLGCTLGLDEFDNLDLKIYPNPTAGKLSISGLNAPIQRISLVDVYGKLISFSSKNEISLEQLASGIYFLMIESNDQRITRKIIKE